MTKVYFIRHAQADNANQDYSDRPLTEKGMADRRLVTDFLKDKNIQVMFSSPYKRAIDTIAEFAGIHGFDIEIAKEFKEREIGRLEGVDTRSIVKRQWEDFSLVLPEGESLGAAQKRNVDALKAILARQKDKNIVIGTHSTILSTIINYYDSSWGFDDFMAMVHIAPWVVMMEFDGINCLNIDKIDLFDGV